jgi:hypothetical protein
MGADKKTEWIHWRCVRALNYARKQGGGFALWPYGKFGHFHVNLCVKNGWLTKQPPAFGEVAPIAYELTDAGRAHVMASIPPEYFAKEYEGSDLQRELAS